MTRKEKKLIKEKYNELVDHYGTRLADFQTHPRIFAFQVKCYEYYRKAMSKESDEPKVVDFTEQG